MLSWSRRGVTNTTAPRRSAVAKDPARSPPASRAGLRFRRSGSSCGHVCATARTSTPRQSQAHLHAAPYTCTCRQTARTTLQLGDPVCTSTSLYAPSIARVAGRRFLRLGRRPSIAPRSVQAKRLRLWSR
ncbi:hypothetical protein PsYK624_123080 [Phanerochaete sordida]|uniref:Uncharacterized protein n=1 Tax=Phanerochaete sordida TaxID=48140 RepID=A0A9P3LI89_9APHY|nr:hypothetical protein PsYK624_123080 [Phanerochaete sordida]